MRLQPTCFLTLCLTPSDADLLYRTQDIHTVACPLLQLLIIEACIYLCQIQLQQNQEHLWLQQHGPQKYLILTSRWKDRKYGFCHWWLHLSLSLSLYIHSNTWGTNTLYLKKLLTTPIHEPLNEAGKTEWWWEGWEEEDWYTKREVETDLKKQKCIPGEE